MAKCGLTSIQIEAGKELFYSTPQGLARFLREKYSADPAKVVVVEENWEEYAKGSATSGVAKKKGEAIKSKVETVVKSLF